MTTDNSPGMYVVVFDILGKPQKGSHLRLCEDQEPRPAAGHFWYWHGVNRVQVLRAQLRKM